jgi:hypothetical protein
VVTSCVDVPVCLSTPDRYRHVPDRYIPLPISCNIEFVFPPGCSRPVPVPGKQKQEQERFGCFPDRSRSLSSLVVWQPAFAAPHAPARQRCHAGQPLSRARRGPARPPFFFLFPFFLSRPEPRRTLTAAGRRPLIPAPNRWIWGGESGGNCSSRPCEGIPLLLSMYHRCIM